MTFASVLSDYRARTGLSQTKLAALIDRNHSLIARYESGQRFPERDTLEVLSFALGLDRSERIHLALSAGFVPEGIAQSPDLIDALTAVICAFEGRPTRRTVQRKKTA